ncbi:MULTISPECIES: hypothetical protein [unclassified Streptomyces]|uniref:hypothetical protein n=1 Tax=unclassified Streptomyces TaxID=2593676 RepID=UPI00382B15EF
MSHASATPVTPHSARITEAAPARPLLVVETLDHSAGSTMLFTFCADPVPATPNAATFTFCAEPLAANVALTYTYGAETTAPVAVESDAVVGSWI